MRINPVYQFNTTTDTGIDQVPVNAKIIVMDDGTGKPAEFMKKAMGAFGGASTIADFMGDPTSFHSQSVGGMGDLDGIDLTTSTPTTNDYLKFDGTNWVPGVPETVAFDDLSDIDVTTVTPTDGQSLVYDLAGTKWVPGTISTASTSLNDITDVDLTTVAPTDGQVIVYDLAGTKWVPSTISTTVDALNDITDVNIAAPTDGQVVSWDNATSKWVASTPAGGSSELSKITENSKTGWRLLGRDAANVGDIGNNAIDFSYNYSASSIHGATGSYSFACGYSSTASGSHSFAANQSKASGGDSFATGFSEASGGMSFATGISSATNNYAVSSGYHTTASGEYSHSEGKDTLASGSASHAEGLSTTSSGYYAHAEGTDTLASGDYGSHAEGKGTIALNASSHAEGKYNIGTATDTIHETGIGADVNNRKNAFEIYTDGRVRAPELTNALINTPRSLITKEYLEANSGNATVADDLTDVDTTTVAPVSGDVLKFDGTNWIPGTVTAGAQSIAENVYTATASQTAFVVSGSIFGTTICEVFTNGIRERRSSYSIADDGTDTTVTFGTARSENDLVDIIVY